MTRSEASAVRRGNVRPLRWLAVVASLVLTLAGCAAEDPGLSGRWRGTLELEQLPGETLRVELHLEQEGPALDGLLGLPDARGDELWLLRGVAFDVREGVVAEDGELYFNAYSKIPAGNALLKIHGRSSASGIEGEVGVTIDTTEGNRTYDGRLTVTRAR